MLLLEQFEVFDYFQSLQLIATMDLREEPAKAPSSKSQEAHSPDKEKDKGEVEKEVQILVEKDIPSKTELLNHQPQSKESHYEPKCNSFTLYNHLKGELLSMSQCTESQSIILARTKKVFETYDKMIKNCCKGCQENFKLFQIFQQSIKSSFLNNKGKETTGIITALFENIKENLEKNCENSSVERSRGQTENQFSNNQSSKKKTLSNTNKEIKLSIEETNKAKSDPVDCKKDRKISNEPIEEVFAHSSKHNSFQSYCEIGSLPSEMKSVEEQAQPEETPKK